MKKYLLYFAPILTAIFLSGCGGGSSSGSAGGGTPANLPVAIEGLGSELVAADATFKYTPGDGVALGGVSTDNLYIVEGSPPSSNVASPLKDAQTLDTNPCDPDNALPASLDKSSGSYALLDPTSDLACNTAYTACVELENLMYPFTTEACGVALSITSVTDANSTAVLGGSTGVQPSSFNVVFDAALDSTSCLDDAVTLECGSLTPSLTVTEADAANTYTVTVADAWKYALMECTLTVANSCTALSGTAGMSADANYTFTNTVALNDDFNADSSAYWTFSDVDAFNITDWDTAASSGVLVIDGDNSVITYDITSRAEGALLGIYKTVTASPSGFEIILHFKSASGFSDDGPGLFANYVGVFLSKSLEPDSDYILVSITGNNVTQYCALAAFPSGGAKAVAMATAECSDSDAEYYIKLSVDEDEVSYVYKVGDGEWADLTVLQDDGDFFTSPSLFLDTFGDANLYLYLVGIDFDNLGSLAEVDSIQTSGITGRDGSEDEFVDLPEEAYAP